MTSILVELKAERSGEQISDALAVYGQGISEYRMSKEWREAAHIALKQSAEIREKSRNRICYLSTFRAEK